jgi:hypothetical protein
MSDRAKVNENVEPSLKKRFDIYAFATVASAVVVAVLAIPPVYWSYMCRSSGKWCEGSLVSPRADSDTREQVAKQIASDKNGSAFLGLQVRSAGFWPINDRLDVVAKFDDGSETAIDTMPPTVAYEVHATPDRAFVGVASTSEHPQASRLTAYFPFSGLTKRVFDIAPSYGEGLVALRSLTYQPEKKRIVVDIKSPTVYVKINDNKNFALGHTRYSTDGSDYGATVAIELSETLHVRSAFTVENEERFAQSEKAFNQCRTDAESRQHNDGDVELCERSQDSNLARIGGSLSILNWQGGKLVEVATNTCGEGSYWMRDPSKKAAYVTCDISGSMTGSSVTWLSIYRPPFEEETYFLNASSCDELSLYDIRAKATGDYVFQLWTNCAKVSVNDKAFDIELPPDGNKLRAMYVLELDEHQIPQALKPL